MSVVRTVILFYVICLLYLFSFFLRSVTPSLLMRENSKMASEHSFKKGDLVKMVNGKYCGRQGRITKPTRKMAWVHFSDRFNEIHVCLLPSHMSKIDSLHESSREEVPTTLHRNAEESIEGALERIRKLESQVSTLVTREELRNVESSINDRLDDVNDNLVLHITEAIDSLRIKSPTKEV